MSKPEDVEIVIDPEVFRAIGHRQEAGWLETRKMLKGMCSAMPGLSDFLGDDDEQERISAERMARLDETIDKMKKEVTE